MNVANQLNELTQDTLNFAAVINATENSADSDFRNACNLFSQYMNSQLEIICSNPLTHSSFSQAQDITEQLQTLSTLIAPSSRDFIDTHHWPNKLVDFCKHLQLLKRINQRIDL